MGRWGLIVCAAAAAGGCAGYANEFAAPPGAPPPPSPERAAVTAADLLAVRDALPFRSREQLLQIFHEMLADPARSRFEMAPGEIGKLAEAIESLFPLEACRRMVFEDGILWLAFDEEQVVHIPDTAGQAALCLSPDLGLALRRSGATTRCDVSWGGVRLHVTPLVRWLYPMARDIQAARLDYTPAPGSSRIEARQAVRIPAADVRIFDEGGRRRVDLVHPHFPGEDDLVVDEEGARLFGARLDAPPPELPPADWIVELEAVFDLETREVGYSITVP